MSDVLTAGREALERGEWEEARTLLEAELRGGESPELLEQLAIAARWMFDGEAAFGATERAYRLYRQRGDDRSAGRAALSLAMLAYNLRRADAVMSGWLDRARHLLDGVEATSEGALARALEAHLALIVHNDPTRARALCAEAAELARAVHAVDPEMLALGLDGLAQVTQGQVEEGLRSLDEAVAAAVAGDVSDPELLQTICCYLIYACKRVRDFDRAGEWCARVQEAAHSFSDHHMFAVCRVHYADVLLWRGAWGDAERELEAATEALDSITGQQTADGRIRLADLRRRQGRFDEAERLLAEADTHQLAPLVRGELDLERGDALAAAECAERYLRRIPAVQMTERTVALELLVRARIGTHELERAREAVEELAAIVAAIPTEPLRGAHTLAAGLLAAAEGEYDNARQLLEDAVDLLAAGHSPYESARARVALARVLEALGRRGLAEREAERAAAALSEIGADAEARRARALLPAARQRPADDGLTRREAEILALVAAGRTNEQIASELVLSLRTVERHVSNIYAKLGLIGRNARAAAVAYAGAHGYV